MSWHSRWKDRIDRIRIRTVNGSLLECEGKECYKLNLGPCGKTNLLTPGCGGENTVFIESIKQGEQAARE